MRNKPPFHGAKETGKAQNDTVLVAGVAVRCHERGMVLL
jgi:hypothetical protein